MRPRSLRGDPIRRRRNRNHALDVAFAGRQRHAHWYAADFRTKIEAAGFVPPPFKGAEGGNAPAADKRTLVYAAVRSQLEHDNKRPWRLEQKLNDTPYRYTRDTLWAALNRISNQLGAADPPVTFGTEARFQHPTVPSFAKFVNRQLTTTVSELINGIMEASRWSR